MMREFNSISVHLSRVALPEAATKVTFGISAVANSLVVDVGVLAFDSDNGGGAGVVFTVGKGKGEASDFFTSTGLES